MVGLSIGPLQRAVCGITADDVTSILCRVVMEDDFCNILETRITLQEKDEVRAH